MHDNRSVDPSSKFLCRAMIIGNNYFSVRRTVGGDVSDRLIYVCDHLNGKNAVQIFGFPVFLSGDFHTWHDGSARLIPTQNTCFGL